MARKEGKDRGIGCGFLASNRIINGVGSKTPDGVMLEVGSRCLILQILEATNPTSTYFASGSGAGKKVAGSIVVVLESNIRVEE